MNVILSEILLLSRNVFLMSENASLQFYVKSNAIFCLMKMLNCYLKRHKKYNLVVLNGRYYQWDLNLQKQSPIGIVFVSGVGKSLLMLKANNIELKSLPIVMCFSPQNTLIRNLRYWLLHSRLVVYNQLMVSPLLILL